eukprot:PhF_6_TR11665/c0_g1_i1/m.18849
MGNQISEYQQRNPYKMEVLPIASRLYAPTEDTLFPYPKETTFAHFWASHPWLSLLLGGGGNPPSTIIWSQRNSTASCALNPPKFIPGWALSRLLRCDDDDDIASSSGSTHCEWACSPDPLTGEVDFVIVSRNMKVDQEGTTTATRQVVVAIDACGRMSKYQKALIPFLTMLNEKALVLMNDAVRTVHVSQDFQHLFFYGDGNLLFTLTTLKLLLQSGGGASSFVFVVFCFELPSNTNDPAGGDQQQATTEEKSEMEKVLDLMQQLSDKGVSVVVVVLYGEIVIDPIQVPSGCMFVPFQCLSPEGLRDLCLKVRSSGVEVHIKGVEKWKVQSSHPKDTEECERHVDPMANLLDEDVEDDENEGEITIMPPSVQAYDVVTTFGSEYMSGGCCVGSVFWRFHGDNCGTLFSTEEDTNVVITRSSKEDGEGEEVMTLSQPLDPNAIDEGTSPVSRRAIVIWRVYDMWRRIYIETRNAELLSDVPIGLMVDIRAVLESVEVEMTYCQGSPELWNLINPLNDIVCYESVPSLIGRLDDIYSQEEMYGNDFITEEDILRRLGGKKSSNVADVVRVHYERRFHGLLLTLLIRSNVMKDKYVVTPLLFKRSRETVKTELNITDMQVWDVVNERFGSLVMMLLISIAKCNVFEAVRSFYCNVEANDDQQRKEAFREHVLEGQPDLVEKRILNKNSTYEDEMWEFVDLSRKVLEKVPNAKWDVVGRCCVY